MAIRPRTGRAAHAQPECACYDDPVADADVDLASGDIDAAGDAKAIGGMERREIFGVSV